ncbi:MipA/OmpV family protein [Paraburkholderia phenazinium]|uniref:Outer membrane protein n=1 Tax=Paraburkholderia phenazinium TaxID=60549 RepID=A0A1G7TVY3_9BURK|nr:MipA/OmpV family protein [Paraburkholderia phenazinium]SDG38660.1 outer membrane protein [Paraburkholderia phenazinium]
MKARVSRSVLTLLLGTLLGASTFDAMADETAASTAPDAMFADTWHFTAGGGVLSLPKYPGASDRKFEPIPLLGATYGRYFIGTVPDVSAPLGLGAYLYRDSHWQVAAMLSYDFIQPRDQSDDARLQGLGDIPRTAHAGIFGSYTVGWFTARGSVFTDILGKHEGTVATLGLEGKYQPSDRLSLSAGPGLTWGSSQYNRTFYGVDQGQSISSGLPAYAPGSGVASFNVSVKADYRISRQWGVGAAVVATELRGDVGASPIVEKKTQVTYGVFSSYRF